jgi:hypothetical protein
MEATCSETLLPCDVEIDEFDAIVIAEAGILEAN